MNAPKIANSLAFSTGNFIFGSMAYVAMARKWRPNSFADMVGQEHIAQTIQNAIQGGRLHHAFLFTGTRGVGKTSSARILARILNCSGPDPISPCGECPSCKDIATGNPMDVMEIDAASHTGVDDMRDILEQVQYTPMIGKYKVFVIDEVHMLSKSAFNALLKTLEEPPSHVIFIFATTEVNKVPQTILSRVQRFDFKRLSARQIADRLHYICTQENIQQDADALAIVAEKADGSMRDALTYFDQVYAFSGKDLSLAAVQKVLGIPPDDLYFKLATAIRDHEPKACFEVVDTASTMGIELSILIDGFARFLRNLLYSRVSGLSAEVLEISEPMYARLQSAVPELGSGDILRIAKILSELQGGLRYTSSPRLQVETTFARMAWLDRVTDLRRALAALDNPTTPQEPSKKKLTPDVLPRAESPGPSARPMPAAPAPALPVAPIAPEGFAIDFGDGSFSGGAPASAAFAAPDFDEPAVSAPGLSRFDVEAQWKSLVNSFCEQEPLGGAYLQGTKLERGDYTLTPFPLTVHFRGSQQWQYNQFSTHPTYQTNLLEFLEQVLQTPVDLRLSLLAATPEEMAQAQGGGTRSLSPFEIDLKNEPIISTLLEIFEAEPVGMRRVPREAEYNHEPSEPGDHE
jgi:DNA polymerase III subunit gamma/tau